MIAGIILAAGFSSRMGQPKALLRLGESGPTFVCRLVCSLRQARLDPVIVVAGVDAGLIRAALQDVEPAVTVAVNDDPARGQLSSLIVGLDACDRTEIDAALIVPVDQPLISPATVTSLVDQYRRTGAAIVRPVHGARHGHPVIFDRRLFKELRRANPAEGARSVVRIHAADVADVPIEDEGAFADIDTREDYERLIGPLDDRAVPFTSTCPPGRLRHAAKVVNDPRNDG